MLRGSKDTRDPQGGFTLIELLIVIVILGVLAAVVILAVGAFNDRGELAACKADVKAVEVAVEAFRAKEDRYPESLAELTQAPGNYLRELPNTTEGSGDYWIRYEPESGTVEGRLKNNDVCAGGLALAGPSSTSTSGPGGGGPGGGGPSNSPSPSGGGNPSNSSSPSGGVAQPPGFPLTIQPETMVSEALRDTLCGEWGDFLGGGSQEYLTSWESNSFQIPQGFTGTYRVTIHVDSNRSVNSLRLRYRSGTQSWSTATTWNVANGCHQTFSANITFTSSGNKQIQLDKNNWGNNEWLLLESVQITRIA